MEAQGGNSPDGMNAAAFYLDRSILDITWIAGSPSAHGKFHRMGNDKRQLSGNARSSGRPLVWRRSLLRCDGVFISCVNLWRYFHLMGSPILTLWGHGQSKSLFLLPRHSHVMRKPTLEGEKEKKKERRIMK